MTSSDVILCICFSVQYLDENKQLILAILDNQNLGKLNECATYVANPSARSVFPVFVFPCLFYEKLGVFILIFSGLLRQENPYFLCIIMSPDYFGASHIRSCIVWCLSIGGVANAGMQRFISD